MERGRAPLARPALAHADLASLRSAFESLGGAVEWAASKAFAVVTVPGSAGFPALEAVLDDFVRGRDDFEWIFGNVYGADGQALDWW